MNNNGSRKSGRLGFEVRGRYGLQPLQEFTGSADLFGDYHNFYWGDQWGYRTEEFQTIFGRGSGSSGQGGSEFVRQGNRDQGIGGFADHIGHSFGKSSEFLQEWCSNLRHRSEHLLHIFSVFGNFQGGGFGESECGVRELSDNRGVFGGASHIVSGGDFGAGGSAGRGDVGEEVGAVPGSGEYYCGESEDFESDYSVRYYPKAFAGQHRRGYVAG